MFKKAKIFFLVFSLAVIISAFMSIKEIYALDSNSSVKRVEPDKVWRIRFNSFVKFDDNAKNNIKVLDETGKSAPVFVEKENDNSINSKPGKVVLFDNLKMSVNSEGKTAKDLKYGVKKYIDEKGQKGEILCDTRYTYGQVLNIPAKLNGWFKVSAGYVEGNNSFGVKDSASGEGDLISDYAGSYSDKQRVIKEKIVFISNFNNSTIQIEPNNGMKLAYIKLTGLTEKEIALASSKDERKPVILDIDGYSKFFEGRLGSEENLLNETVRAVNRNNISTLNWCLGTTGLLNYNSKFAGNPTDAFNKHKNTMRTGDFKAKEQIEYFIKKGKTPLSIIAKEGDAIGTETYASLRMDIFYDPTKYGFLNGTIYDKLIKYKQPTNWNLDYQYPQVRDYIKNIIKEAASTEGVDGITLDFCRYPVIIGIYVPQNKKVQIMNSFMREIRKSIPKNKKINVRIPYNEYLKDGYDLKTWIKEGLVDVIIPSGLRYEEEFDIKPFVNMVKGSNVKVYQCVIANVSGSDYTKKDELTGNIEQKTYLEMEDYLKIINKAYGNGVDGIFLFNTSTYSEIFSSPKQLRIYNEIYNQHKIISKKIKFQ
ncbi:hypothetical protein [Clostridium sp. ZS2-4]|uniref:hypothetical protein n=1 Tax=Clostridium sp. ZS2-4 TaxID=2987703 RepID=UPI00227C4B2D|nr:hypothetical protein [Clostridium sp. ZS2-4]MCY6353889.1 hypothetical protein [Clostridium sp. ZS2-4]